MPRWSSSSIDRLIRCLVACALVIGLSYIPDTAASVLPERSQPFTQADLTPPILFRSASTRAASTTFDSPIVTPTSISEPAATSDLTIAPTLISVSAAISQTGGHLTTADNRIQVDVPPNLFGSPTVISITPRLVNSVTDLPGMILRFDLDAKDTLNGAKLTAFNQPMTLTVDLRGLIDRTQLKPYEHLVIFHLIGTPDAPWSELQPVEIAPNVLQVSLNHFSSFAAGSSSNESNGWQLKYNPPVVSLFSGAATYQYPLQIPAGRGGLTPDVALSYSSRSVDGLVSLNYDDTDGLPPGWALDMASISRGGITIISDGANGHLHLPDQFALTINGTGYDLTSTVAGASYGRYYAQDAPNLYVERRNDNSWNGTPANTSHEYWIVKTGDGTTYRFGYNSDSEQYISQAAGFANCDGAYCGANCPGGSSRCDGAASRWRVDQITSPVGNVITFSYYTHSTTDGNTQPVTSEHTRIQSIDYNFVNSAATSRVVFDNSTCSCNWINRIKVYNAGTGGANEIREYRLTQTYNTSANMYIQLDSITTYDGVGSTALPATTFVNTGLVHAPDYGSYVGAIPYITRIDNGYGGATEFTYLSDNRAETHENDVPGGWPIWSYGYSYIVTEMRTYDGLNPQPAKVQYAYGQRCYDQTGNGTLQKCTGANPQQDGPLVGHAVVTQTLLSFAGASLQVSRHSYYADDANRLLRGKENLAQTFDPVAPGTPLQQVNNYYYLLPVGPITNTALRQSDASTYSGGFTATKTVSYTYDPYGNQIRQYEMGNAAVSGDERTTQTGFNPITTVTNIPATNYYARSNAVASSQIAGFEAGKAIDNIVNQETGWQSQNHGAAANTEWLSMTVSAQPVDFVELYPFIWAGTVSGFPISFTIYAISGGQSIAIFSATNFSPPPVQGSVVLTLTNVVTPTNLKIVATKLGAQQGGGYSFGLAEMKAGHTPYPNTGQWIVNQPAWSKTCSNIAVSSCTTVRETRNYYDGATDYLTAPTKGLLTQAATGLSGSIWVTTSTAYDSWGNVVVVTDTRGYTTTTAYDNQYHLYPMTVTNALNQTIYTNYDLALGVPITMTDANGAVTGYAYDAFSRLVKAIKPGDSAASPSTRYEYREYPWLVLPNSGFETSDNWTEYDPSGVETWQYDTTQFHSGSRSLKITATSSADHWMGRSDIYGWVPGDTYWVRAYVKALTPAQFCLALSDRTSPVHESTIGCVTANSTWQIVQGTVTMVSDADRFLLLLRTPQGGTVYVDDVQIGVPLEVGKYLKEDAAGNTRWSREVYDGLGRLVQSQSEKDNTQAVVVNQQYDARSLLTQQTVPTEMTSTPNGINYLQPSWAEPKTSTQYDALGRAILITATDGTTTTHLYQLDVPDSRYTATNQWLEIVTDANRHAKHFVKDVYGQLIVVRELTGTIAPHPMYAQTFYDYDALGSLTTVTDTLGNTTVITYNSLGLKTEMLDPDMGRWQYQYDPAGNLITQTDALAHSLVFRYDALNRLTQKWYSDTLAITQVATYTYDTGPYAIGKRTALNDPSGSEGWTYDTRGRVINDVKSINSAGTYTTAFGYDSLDRVLTTTYPTGEVVTQTYNAMGTLENLRSPTYNQWYASNLDYNANGSLARLDLGNGLSTLYGYFGFTANPWDGRPSPGLYQYGRLWRIRTEAPSGQVQQDLRYAYDNVGNITYLTDVPRAITGSIVPTMTDGFTSTSRWVLGSTTNITIPFNDGGNTVAKLTGTGINWNANLYRTEFALPTNTGSQVRFKVNSATAIFVLGLENNDSTYRRLTAYGDGSGHLRIDYNDGAGYRYPVALTPTLSLNTWYTLTVLVDDVRGNTIQVDNSSNPSVHYVYNVGFTSGKSWRFHAWVWSGSVYLDDYMEFNGGAAVVPDERMNFTYDSLDRLLSAAKTTNDGYTQSYGYNQIGNIISTTMLGAYAYNSSGANSVQPHAVITAGNNLYSYDANGNMTFRIEVTGTQRITYTQSWDTENRLTTVTNTVTSPNVVSNFIYDGDGNRVLQVVISGTSIMTTAYAGTMEIAITPPPTQTQQGGSGCTGITPPTPDRSYKLYYSAGSQLMAMRVLTYGSCSGVLYFLSSDHLGSSSFTTDASGNVVARQLYDAWGNIRSGGGMPTDISFTGQRLDYYIKLLQMGARWYDPDLGRFISADTIVPDSKNPQHFNRYSYTNNNPIRYVDPSGHFTCEGADKELCQKTIQNLLDMLANCGKGGGETCKQIAEYFRSHDTVDIPYCASVIMCSHYELKDQLHIIIESDNTGYYMQGGGDTVRIGHDAWQDINAGVDPKYLAGQFAHEIEHMRQGLFGGAGTVNGEVKAFGLEYRVLNELGYIPEQHMDNIYAKATVEAYALLSSPAYTQLLPESVFKKSYYPSMPIFSLLEKLIAPWQPWFQAREKVYQLCPLCAMYDVH